MHLGRWMAWSGAATALGLVLALAPTLTSAGADAAERRRAQDAAVATALAIAGTPGHAGERSPLRVRLSGEDGAPVADARVTLERRRDGVWGRVGRVVTGPAGGAEHQATLARVAADNVWRATYAGDGEHSASLSEPLRVPLVRWTGVLTLTGPRSVVDERRVLIGVRWTTRDGAPIQGEVTLHRRLAREEWAPWRTLLTGADGRASVRERPRSDSRWRAVVRRQDWVAATRSAVLRIDNRPPGEPVRLPRAAPRPRRSLAPQARAVGRGANAVVTPIPGRVWRQMTGVTWHRGCPVGRAGLRLVRVNYWAYDGYRRRGELVAAAGAASQMAGALAAMYRHRLPLRSLYRVDRFGWSGRLHGGDDYASMAAGNTSAFNCRDVVGQPGTRSPHSWGRSLDVNPWENPYRSSGGWVPHPWWVGRAHPQVAWRSTAHPVVRLLARHGLHWTFGRSDAHHFDATTGRGRILVRDCGAVDCE